MATSLTIPKLAMSMTEGQLVEWLVEDGADVSEGQPIYVLESEKTTQDIEAPATGKLAHKVQSGEIYPVGTEIGEIG